MAGVNTIEQFGHHVYEPSSAVTETVIIPLTRRTEEFFENIYARNASRGSLRERRESLVENSVDPMMENVLKWSMATNLPDIEPGRLGKDDREQLGKIVSHV